MKLNVPIFLVFGITFLFWLFGGCDSRNSQSESQAKPYEPSCIADYGLNKGKLKTAIQANGLRYSESLAERFMCLYFLRFETFGDYYFPCEDCAFTYNRTLPLNKDSVQEYLISQYQLDMSGEPNDFEQGTLELCDCSLVQLAKALQDYSHM